jgi:gamma-glutamyltranspeptidase/glutathione hydrolase
MPRGACASGDPSSAQAGADVLAAGGNAVDAAVAAALMASFSVPTMTGLGGGALATLRVEGRVLVLDGFANLPGLGAEGRARREPDRVTVDFEDVRQPFLVGPSTVAVPGVVALLWEAHRRFGRMPLREVAAASVRAAREGAPVGDGQYRAAALLEEIFRREEAAWRLIGDEEGLHPVGHRMVNPALADTLELLVEEGERAFYEGEVAAAIVRATEGLVTREDLRAYRCQERGPLVRAWGDRLVHAPGAPSLTGPLLLVALGDLEAGGPLARPFGPQEWGRIAEAIRRSGAVRTPEFEARLFEEGYLEDVVATCPGGSTLHCSTIDAGGTAMSTTLTIGECAGTMAGRFGFMLNNFLGEPDILPPGTPWRPGRRMMTSMGPSLVRDGAGRWLAIGSAGSARIRSAILHVLVRIAAGERLQEAIGRPRLHVEGETLYVEGHGRTRAEVEALRPYAPRLVATWAAAFYFGGVQAVAEVDGGFDAGADVVRRGSAAFVV